jgi:cell wall assembly regulator SMI1
MKRIHKIGIGVVIPIVVVMAVGFWATQKGLRTFFYPLAPPMPPVVDEPMPDILAHLESVLKTNAPQVLATLQPGISSNQISQLEQQYHVQVPKDIQAIYKWHDGALAINTTNYFDNLIPFHHFVPLEDMLPDRAAQAPATATLAQRTAYRLFAGYRDNWYCLFDDGTDNGYFFDPTRKPTEGAVFRARAAEGNFTFFPSPKNLMAGIAKCYEQNAYRGAPDSSPPEAEEDFEQSQKIWSEFGARNHQEEQ